MGASIKAQVHFFDRSYPRGSFEDGSHAWDFSRDLDFTSGKDYVFFSAISGVRGPEGFTPLIPLRGMPPGRWPGWREDSWLEEGGWLHYSEIEAALKHRGVNVDDLYPYTQRVLRAMKLLVDELGDSQVRLVFRIY